MGKFLLEFILNTRSASAQTLKNSIVEFCRTLEIVELPLKDGCQGRDFKISIDAEDPAIIFDTCAQFGKFKSVKINEEGHP